MPRSPFSMGILNEKQIPYRSYILHGWKGPGFDSMGETLNISNPFIYGNQISEENIQNTREFLGKLFLDRFSVLLHGMSVR